MKIHKAELAKEWYILTPINQGGELTKGLQVSYNDSLDVEPFTTELDYLVRCEELGIEILETI